MLFFELLKTAIIGILTHKLRSLLTMLGIIIGVAAVITMTALGEGAKTSVTNSIKELGANLLFVRPGAQRQGPAHIGNVQTLKESDALAIQKEISNIIGVTVENSKNFQIKYFNKNVNTSVIGVGENYDVIRNYKVEAGRFINETDINALKRVCVIGKTVQTALFNEMNPLGLTIKIRGVPFEIIGVLKEKGQSGFRDNDDLIFIPISIFQKRLTGLQYIQSIIVQVDSENNMPKVEKDLTVLLRKLHKINSTAENDFNIRSQAEILSQMNEVTKTFTYLLAGVAAVSLLVGGIGIMNIMLVSVSERTREIGIRKAIGAKRKDILIQFLLESIMISFLGGVLGVLLGIALSKFASNLVGFETIITQNAVFISATFSICIGLFFGIYPANKAAKLKPIEALRYE